MYVYIDLITNNFLRKLTFSWEEFLTLVFIGQTFYYWSAMIRACSQQFSDNWDFAEKIIEHSFSLQTLIIIGLLWFELVLSNFQKADILLRRVSNTRFHCIHFLLLVWYDSGFFSAIFRKLRFCWEEFWTHVFIADTFNYWSAMIQGCSQQFSECWDFAEKSFEHMFFHS